MKRLTYLVILATFMIFYSAGANATVIGFDPVSQDVLVGSTASVNLVIQDVGDYTAPSVSTYDLNILFDPTILQFNSAVFGNGLDVWGMGMNARDASVASPGTLNIYEISFDSPDDLNDYQPGSFTLATLSFDALSAGESPLDISINALGDAYGDPLGADLSSGSITATSAAAPVPEPATLFLFLNGLAGIGYFARKKFFRS